MRVRLRSFGYTVCSVSVDLGSAPEFVEEPAGIAGSGTASLERDPFPPNPTREEPLYEERFGFH